MDNNLLNEGASENIKDFNAAFVPYGEKSPDAKSLRKEGFRAAGSSGNGMLSLAKIELFIKHGLGKHYSRERADVLFRAYRPAYRHAFDNAKDLGDDDGKILSGATTATADDYVSFSEFRVFTVLLRIYATMFDTFANIDGDSEGRTKNDDMRVDLGEFLRWFRSSGSGPNFLALQNVNSVDEATTLFQTLDSDNSGKITFNEWCSALKRIEIENYSEIGGLLGCNITPTTLPHTATGDKTEPHTATSDKTGSHYRLSKKVATLTKVIVKLNSLNDNYAAETQRAHEQLMLAQHQVQAVKEAHSSEINAIAEEADRKVELLQTEHNAKTTALQEQINASKEIQLTAHEQLASLELGAKARIDKLKSSHERERISHAQTVRDISRSLEEQAQQHQENILSLQKDLAGEHKKHIEIFQEETNRIHSEETGLLESQHEQTLLRIQTDVCEQHKSTVENAVASTTLKYEKKLSEQLRLAKALENKIKCVEETNEALQERMKCQEEEIPSLRANLDRLQGVVENHASNEIRLQADVKKLQTSLDSTASSNQRIIKELQEHNSELFAGEREATQALGDQLDHIKGLEVENIELKSLLDTIHTQKTILESDLKSLSCAHGEEHQLNLINSEEREAKIQNLQAKLGDVKSTNIDLVEQVSLLKDQSSELVKYKNCMINALATINILRLHAEECRRDSCELACLFVSLVEGFTKCKCALQEMYCDNTATLENSAMVLAAEVEGLRLSVGGYERLSVEAKVSMTALENKVKYMEEIAENAAIARIGERLSWERSVEDTKIMHRRELARICCVAQDEQDILGNQIAELKDDITKQRESAECKAALVEVDWRRHIEVQQAATSRVKYESALEIQRLSVRMDGLSDTLASKESEYKSLIRDIESMRELQERKETEHFSKLESSCQRHHHEVQESNNLHDKLFRQKEEQIELMEHEQQKSLEKNAVRDADFQHRIDKLKECIASERSDRIHELRGIKSHLRELRASSEQIKQDWESLCSGVISGKLRRMEQIHAATAERHSSEVEQLEKTHHEAQKTCDQQIAELDVSLRDSKSMLFSTIRESDTKLERTIRHLREDHEIEMKALVNDGKMQCEVLTGKLSDLTQEYDAIASANAKKVDVIIQKDKDINRHMSKMSDIARSFEDQIHSIQLQHEHEQAEDLRQIQVKETLVVEKHAKEMCDLQAELQLKMDGVAQQLRDANKRWDDRPSRPEDAETIKALKDEIQSLSVTEALTREKMLFFKRELENREENFSRMFVADDAAANSPLRVIQNAKARPDAGPATRVAAGATTRRKARGRTGVGTRKKKATASSQRLPKIAK